MNRLLSFVVLAFVVLALFATPSVTNGQSLAEIARKEEARRKAVQQPSKVYTNGDLRGDITRSRTPATPPEGTPPEGTAPPPSTQVPEITLPGGKAEAVPSAKDETYWRTRITVARAALERTRILADALQSRLNALTNDIVGRDDPAQRSQLELERQRALSELERVKRETADQTKAISDIEEEARKAGVPPGWLR